MVFLDSKKGVGAGVDAKSGLFSKMDRGVGARERHYKTAAGRLEHKYAWHCACYMVPKFNPSTYILIKCKRREVPRDLLTN